MPEGLQGTAPQHVRPAPAATAAAPESDFSSPEALIHNIQPLVQSSPEPAASASADLGTVVIEDSSAHSAETDSETNNGRYRIFLLHFQTGWVNERNVLQSQAVMMKMLKMLKLG